MTAGSAGELRFGVTLPQFTSDPERFTDGVKAAEDAGLDSVWVFDHLWPLGGKRDMPILECWTALAWAAAATTRVQVGTLVTRSSLRHPALVAKMAATVGAIAPGRLVVAIGGGDHLNKQENVAFGAPYLEGGDRIRQLVSTTQLVQRYLKTEAATMAGDLASVSELPPSPRSEPSPRVWMGGRSDEVLEAAGRIADGWNGWGTNVTAFAADAAKVRRIAGERDFEISWAGQVILGADDAGDGAVVAHGGTEPITGAPETVEQRLGDLVAAGARHLIASFPGPHAPASYEAFGAIAGRLR